MIKIQEIIDIPYFKEIRERLDPFVFQTLLKQCIRKVYPPQATIIKQGDKAVAVFLIEEGEVSVLVKYSNINNNCQEGASEVSNFFQINRIRKWQVFGDLNINDPDARRTATVKAATVSKLIVIPKPVYNEFILSTLQIQMYKLQIPFIQLLGINQKIKFCLNSKKKKYNYKNTVYNFHQPSTYVYYIANGQFKIQSTQKGNVNFLAQGCIFGYEQLISGHKQRIHKVTCTSEGILYGFRIQDFNQYYMNNGKVLEQFKGIFYRNKNPYYNSFRIHQKIRDEQKLGFSNLNKTQHRVVNQQQKKEMIKNQFFQKILKQQKFIETIKFYQISREKKSTKKNFLPDPWFKSQNSKLKQKILRIQTKFHNNAKNHQRLNTEQYHYVNNSKTSKSRQI